MISSLHSLRRKIVVVSRILCSNIPRISMQDQQSPRMARSASHQPSECSQTNSLSELDLEDHSSSTFFVLVFKQRKDSSMFASSNQLRLSCTATDLNENFYQYIHRATNLTTNKASTTSKICFWFCTIRINVSSQPFVFVQLNFNITQ